MAFWNPKQCFSTIRSRLLNPHQSWNLLIVSIPWMHPRPTESKSWWLRNLHFYKLYGWLYAHRVWELLPWSWLSTHLFGIYYLNFSRTYTIEFWFLYNLSLIWILWRIVLGRSRVLLSLVFSRAAENTGFQHCCQSSRQLDSCRSTVCGALEASGAMAPVHGAWRSPAWVIEDHLVP